MLKIALRVVEIAALIGCFYNMYVDDYYHATGMMLAAYLVSPRKYD